MVKVTALVSPSERPKPSMMPPMTPTLVYGSTTLRTTSQVVQPMPYADSLSTGGTISNTARLTDEIKGITITERMTPAESTPTTVGAPLNKGPTIQTLPTNFCTHRCTWTP